MNNLGQNKLPSIEQILNLLLKLNSDVDELKKDMGKCRGDIKILYNL